MRSAVVTDARLLHVPEILIAGDGAAAECALFDRVAQRLLFAGLYPRLHQIAHPSKCLKGWRYSIPVSSTRRLFHAPFYIVKPHKFDYALGGYESYTRNIAGGRR